MVEPQKEEQLSHVKKGAKHFSLFSNSLNFKHVSNIHQKQPYIQLLPFIHISTNNNPKLSQSFQKIPIPKQVPYFVSHIECPFGAVRAGLPAREIRAFTNGFVVGGDESCIAVWRCAQRTEEEDSGGMPKTTTCCFSVGQNGGLGWFDNLKTREFCTKDFANFES